MCGAVALAALAASCAEDLTVRTPTVDASLEDSTVSTAVCPEAMPGGDLACSLPEGTTCDFGGCGTRVAQCSGGRWRVGTNPAPKPVCPAEPPTVDAPCPPCWPESATCSYGSRDCTSAEASLNRSVASCADGRWSLEVTPCRDAGANVQADADADAD